MSDELQRLELIEKYVRGQLVGKELSDFESQLKNDPEFSAEVDIFRDILLGTNLAGREKLTEEIKSTHQSLKEKGFFEKVSAEESKVISKSNKNQAKMRSIGMGKWWAMAAGIALLIVASYFVFNTGGNPNYEEVFAQIYEPEKNALNAILDDLSSSGMASADDPHADSLATALKLYKLEEFKEAQDYLSVLVQNDSEDHVARLYLGLALLQQGDYPEASGHLKTISQINGFRYKDVADWYLALCYMGFNSDEGWSLAKEQLKIIANNPNSTYQNDAKSALEML